VLGEGGGVGVGDRWPPRTEVSQVNVSRSTLTPTFLDPEIHDRPRLLPQRYSPAPALWRRDLPEARRVGAIAGQFL